MPPRCPDGYLMVRKQASIGTVWLFTMLTTGRLLVTARDIETFWPGCCAEVVRGTRPVSKRRAKTMVQPDTLTARGRAELCKSSREFVSLHAKLSVIVALQSLGREIYGHGTGTTSIS